MTIRRTVVAVLTTAVFVAVPCSAQKMKPGLWEINNKMQSGNGSMDKAMAGMHEYMAKMSPEDRAAMQEMAASQGMQMPTIGPGGGIAVKVCMTPEMVAADEVPVQNAGNCTLRRSPVVGNTMKVSYSCSEPRTNGEGVVTFANDTNYAVKMKVTSVDSGEQQTMNIDATGRWLGAKCGSIKPAVMPKAK